MNSKDLVVIKLAALGDTAMACQSLIQVYEYGLWPKESRLHWIIDPSYISLAKALLKVVPIEVTFHPFPSKQLLKGTLIEKVKSTLRLIRIVRFIRPSSVAIFHRDRRYGTILKFTSNAKICNLELRQQQEVSLYVETMRKCLPRIDTVINQAVGSYSGEFNSKAKLCGVLVGGGKNQNVNFEEKKWPHLAKFCSQLLMADPQWTILLYGSPEDRQMSIQLMEEIEKSGISRDRIRNRTGVLPLEELPSELGALNVFVSVDSGLAHIAAASMVKEGQKIITLFGPTDSKCWAPTPRGGAQSIILNRQATCAPCYHNDGNFAVCNQSGERFRHCMNDISSESVVKAVLEVNGSVTKQF